MIHDYYSQTVNFRPECQKKACMGSVIFNIRAYISKNIMSRLASKRKEFQKEIRREQIIRRITEIRKHMVQYDFQSLQQLCTAFDLPSNSQRDYSLLDLLIIKRNTLLRVPLGEMQEQSSEKVPLEVHIRFWKYFSEQLYDQKIQYQSLIGEILLQIIDKYSYAQIHYSTVYQLHILNMLELVAPKLHLKQRTKIIDWVKGAEGLRAIYACIEDGNFEFFNFRENQDLYKVIELGLKSELKNESDQAAEILVKILLVADWDDTYQLYSHAHGLAVNLCKKIERYSKETVLKNYNNALYLLVNTYEDAVLDYARGHVAYAAALLICSPVQQNYSDGLEILHVLTQLGSQRLVKFLIRYNQVKDLGMWTRMCAQSIFAKHLNPKVRESYLAVFHNMLALGQQQDLQLINDFFCGQYENIFQMFFQVLENEHQTIQNIILVLNSLQSFLYYGRTQDQPHILLPRFQTCGLYSNIQYRAHNSQGQSAEVSEKCALILATLHNTQNSE